jgi:hypothetical protein
MGDDLPTSSRRACPLQLKYAGCSLHPFACFIIHCCQGTLFGAEVTRGGADPVPRGSLSTGASSLPPWVLPLENFDPLGETSEVK